jgi:hypothetical protein
MNRPDAFKKNGVLMGAKAISVPCAGVEKNLQHYQWLRDCLRGDAGAALRKSPEISGFLTKNGPELAR